MVLLALVLYFLQFIQFFGSKRHLKWEQRWGDLSVPRRATHKQRQRLLRVLYRTWGQSVALPWLIGLPRL